MSAAPSWDWYYEALEGRFGIADRLDPQPGYFRILDAATGKFVPAAIWYDEGVLHAVVGDTEANPFAVWPKAWPRPVTYEDWCTVRETGEWPARPDPSMLDPLTVISDEVAKLIAHSDRLLDADLVEDSSTRDLVADAATLLWNLTKRANAHRTAEKDPHVAAAGAVEARWKPIIRQAETRTKDLKARILAAQKILNQRAAASGAKIRQTSGTGVGRAVGLRSIKTIVITDQRALLTFFANMNELPADIEEAALRVARRMKDAGVDVPGTETVTKEIAA